jgi:probable phosphoglycerate mutase
MARTTTNRPTRTVICFVRHGTTPTTGKVLPGRAKGLHLSDKGLGEAELAGSRLAGLGSVAAIYVSPLERARETASAISRQVGLAVRIDRGLLECDFGDWTGKELVKLAKFPEWQAVQRHPSGFRFPGGESFMELQGRIAATVERLCEKHPGEVVVAVSHADPIKIAVTDALGVPLDLMQRTVISPCSITVVAYGNAAPSVLAVNSTGELAHLGIARQDPLTKASTPRSRSGSGRTPRTKRTQI